MLAMPCGIVYHPRVLKRTSLFQSHADTGGKLVPFAGWEMPVHYGSILDEVRAVRTSARMPLGTREIGARINSLQQGGLPEDVAETVAWLAQPGTSAVNGQVVRVCGQSLLGA